MKTQKPEGTTVLRWILFVAAGVVLLYFGLNMFQGKMLGALVGTTVDPRSALGQRPRSLSMERQLFTLTGAKAACNYKPEKGAKTPEIELSVPKAYINVIRTKKDGWFGSRISSIAFLASSQNFKPYRLEYPRVRKEVLDQLGITLVKRSVRHPKPPGRSSLGDPNEMLFPSDDAKARYDAEVLRRGFTELDVGISTDAEVTEKIRTASLLYFPLGRTDGLRKFQKLDGCVASAGPYPNSVRYDHSPEVLAQAGEAARRIRESCISRRHERHSFAIVQYDEDGQITMTMLCRDYGRKTCHAKFHWKEIWDSKLSVSSKYLKQIPEFIEETKALFDSFEAAARGES